MNALKSKRLKCPNDKLKERTHNLHFIAYKYFYNFKPHKVFSSIFIRVDVTLLKQLASNKNVIVSRLDKGRGVVLLNKGTYINSMTKIVSDRTKFEQIPSSFENCTQKIEDEANNCLHEIKHSLTLPNLKELFATG